MKRSHAYFRYICLRVVFCAEMLKIDANVRNFAVCLLPFTELFGVVLSLRLNIVESIPIKIISLMIVKKVKGAARC